MKIEARAPERSLLL